MASFERGDVIEVPFIIPHNNKAQEHPAIIISNDDVHNADDMCICVMITHSDANDIFAYELTKEMFTDPISAPTGYVKAHLISYVLSSHIIKRTKNRMKKTWVDKLVDFISDNVLKVD